MRYLIGCLILWLVRPALCSHFASMNSADARRIDKLDPADVARWGEGR